MRTKIPLLILLLFCALQIHAQNQKQIDSLLAIIPHSKDTVKVENLLTLSNLCQNTSEDSALLFAHEAIVFSKQIKNNRWIAYSYGRLAGIYEDSQSELDSALYYHQLAKNIFEESHDSIGLAIAYRKISYNLQLQGNITQTHLYLDSASVIYFLKKDTANYIETLLSKMEWHCNTNLARTILKEIFQLSSKCKLEASELAGIYSTAGEFILANEKNDSAIYYLEKSLTIVKEENNLRGISYTSGVLGIAYSKKGNWQKAVYYAEKGLHLAQQNNFMKETGDNLNCLYTIYKAKGDTKNALKYYEQSSKLDDSLNASLKNSSLDRVNLKLTNVKNVSRIELLKRDNEVQQSEVARQKLIRNGVLGSLAVVLGFTFVFFFQRRRISKEKKRSDDLLLNILPSETAEELKNTGAAKAKNFDQVTVMFTDFKNFTQASEKMSAEELVKEINYCYSAFDNIITKHNIEKIKTIGDSYMCAGGLPVENKTNAADTINAALEIQKFMEQYKMENGAKSGFEIRIGIHTGSVVAGIVGTKKFAYDIWGDTVNIASRMESSGEAGKVNISGATYELVKDKFVCIYRGKIQAKNKGEIDMYFADAFSQNE